MKKIVCSDDKSDVIAEKITGEYRLENRCSDIFFYGRQMPNGRLFVPYVGYVEMYLPGEYELVYHYPNPRIEDKEDHNNA